MAVVETFAGRAPVRPGGPVHRLASARTWADAAYLLTSFPVGLFWFTALTALVPLGFGLVFALVGVPVLALVVVAWTFGARAERVRARLLLGLDLASPYRLLPRGSVLARFRTLVTDPATWRDLAYLVVLFPVGIFTMTVTLGLFGGAFGLLTAPLRFWLFGWGPGPGSGFGRADGFGVATGAESLVAAIFGVGLLLVSPYVLRGLATAHGWLATALLAPRATAALSARVDELQESRSRALDASAGERQRIERDLHDGAQARLVALAMNLGMAREKFETEPGRARLLVEEAHEEAKQTLAELRDLVRGIHPAVLADRGLDAALSALAGRCTVPVEVDVQLDEPDGRFPERVESTAYFVAAEALANVARHSAASRASVRVVQFGALLVVDVRDDGVGGADPARGTGLSGLADRLVAVDGRLTVDSPPLGPTLVRAEIPCGW